MARLASCLFGGCATLLLGACTTAMPPALGAQDIQAPSDFTAEYRPEAGPQELWWQGFNDPQLNSLIARALSENLNISAAEARLRAAEAFLKAERSDLLPSINGSGNITVDVNDSGDTNDSAAVSLFGQFTPDISGRLGAEVLAATANLAAAEYFVADQRRLIASAVANQYIELRRTDARLTLLDESTQLQQQTLRIVTLRYEAGLSANLDVRRAAADLARTRAQRGLLELARARASHALAVLVGDAPGAIPAASHDTASVPEFQSGPPRGSPADLLRRRADLLVAEAGLMEAAANIGIERADLLPSLTIPGEIVAGDGRIDKIFANVVTSIGASLNLPLFDGGRRRAEISAAEAEADARFSEYRQTFLTALSEVENALVGISAYTARNTELRQAIDESDAAFMQSNALYREGLASLFDVLDAQRQLISSRESLIDSEASLASSIVALYAAAGAETKV
ncbi:efflux transporter outer membrane subunit [Altererythrobacter indicus]|uniref:Efflux transporter outer membrane subunit n=2 Tax=Altericroceibacterium indicum TaxID=374177 RepID=A0A845AE63_9SPHN|nr:efflux transporter outer membrane subunit [Altericroceibacterium indicum]